MLLSESLKISSGSVSSPRTAFGTETGKRPEGILHSGLVVGVSVPIILVVVSSFTVGVPVVCSDGSADDKVDVAADSIVVADDPVSDTVVVTDGSVVVVYVTVVLGNDVSVVSGRPVVASSKTAATVDDNVVGSGAVVAISDDIVVVSNATANVSDDGIVVRGESVVASDDSVVAADGTLTRVDTDVDSVVVVGTGSVSDNSDLESILSVVVAALVI